MSSWISLLNGGAVSIFGSILSASFCNALQTKKNRYVFWGCMTLILVLQAGAACIWEDALLKQLYPLVMHLPLLIVLFVLNGKVLWSLISILSAYLCCQLRRWIALVVVELFSGGAVMQDAVELIITFPLLLILLYFVSPAVRQLAEYDVKTQLQFGVVPALYYGFDYLARVYTDFLYSGSPAAVEFMPFVCCVLYLVFLLYNSLDEQNLFTGGEHLQRRYSF